MVNNDNFKLKEIPNFHPIADKYQRLEFWKEQKRYCIEGKWSGGKWMPPELYYYINFHHITLEKGIYRGIGLPWCRDIEWEKSLLYTEATGFSGFELDTEYSSNRLLLDESLTKEDFLNVVRLLSDDDKDLYKLYYNNFFTPEGNIKKYVPVQDYLTKSFKSDLGKPIYANSAKHIMETGPRGYGKSMFTSGLIAHNYLFSGARDYDYYIKRIKDKNPLKSETVVGAIDTKYSTKLIDKVQTGLDKLPGASELNIGGDIVKYPSPLSITSEGTFAVGKAYKAISSGSQIQHVTFADNPLAANGGRPNKIFIDEVGFASSIMEIWSAIESTQASETFKRLTIYGMGTGGLTTGGAVTYVQEIFYNPEAYNCVAIPDLWENKGKIGYFIPATKALNEFKEGANYITNETKALKSIELEREAAKKSRQKTKYLGLIINKPLVPSEIFLTMDGNFFNIQTAKKTLAELEVNKRLLDASWKVDLYFDNNQVIAKPSKKLPLRNFPLRREDDLDACIEVFEKPKIDNTGKIPSGRYILATDPVDDDLNDNIKRSLQSTFVLDTWTDRIVAEYTARTYFVDDYYENVRKLCLYYNGMNLYENNKKGLYSHFKNKNSLHLLAETPELFKEVKAVRAEGISNKSVGINLSTDKMKLYGIQRIRSWSEKEAVTNTEEDRGKTNMELLRSPALLKELIAYNMKGNYDRVSALLVLMIFRDELAIRIEAMKTYGNDGIVSTASDTFWTKAYKKYNKGYNSNRKFKIQNL